MLSANLSANYFELFNFPVNFELDIVALTKRYRVLQHVVHPDRFASSTDSEKCLSVQQSAYINEAMQTLKAPLKRAKYILELKGVNMSPETSTQMDQGFLMEQLELREEIAAISTSKNPMESVLAVNSKIDHSMAQLFENLAICLASNKTDELEMARDQVRRLQFFAKVQEEVETLEEQFY